MNSSAGDITVQLYYRGPKWDDAAAHDKSCVSIVHQGLFYFCPEDAAIERPLHGEML